MAIRFLARFSLLLFDFLLDSNRHHKRFVLSPVFDGAAFNRQGARRSWVPTSDCFIPLLCHRTSIGTYNDVIVSPQASIEEPLIQTLPTELTLKYKTPNSRFRKQQDHEVDRS